MSFTRTLRAVGGAVVAGALLLGTAPVASADQIRNEQWPLQKFDAESIWKISTGKGVTVAVIDDPVDGNHADLKGNVLPGKNFITGGTADRPYENREHGTAMASLIAGHGHGAGGVDGVKGLAPDAKILPIGMDLSSTSVGSAAEDYAAPLRYAVDHGARVVNMSIYIGADVTPEEQAAIDYARKHDVLLVAASGNTAGTSTNPASAPGVLDVGAVDDKGRIWEKSNYGPNVKLTAPGVNIRSASPVEDIHGKYRLADGTSDSTAYVSAAAALLRAKFPDLSAGQIANRLIKTASLLADQQGTTLPDQHYGYGSLNPLSALTKDIPAGSKDGPFPAVGGGSSGPSSDPSNAAGDDNGNLKIQSHKGLSTPFIILIAVVVLVLLVIVLIVVMVAKKKGRNGPPPGGPGGFGGPGGPGGPGGFMPNQQPPYQQQPGAPGSYPQGPPTQPPGR
ncbi:S8 family serine peptidase [Streptomyces sp. A1-5]|uniref:S8 family serine peptidase n=1 Tax=Streptomyces sp. A1-5 TaxID=2738410 RepID=UPI001F326685|nr:S8 family serine peptidase [Streptomyces sp. A1-5]UJB44281.1 S8 family serine peptidase [Streptomyces sp. A1-5]